MTKSNTSTLKNQNFKKQISSMLSVDFRRMFTMPFIYIMIGVAFAIPILVLIMTNFMSGTPSTNPTTGEVTTMQGFTNTWQAIATISGDESSSAMSMDLTSMCNINLLYFLVAVVVCVFVAEDFRSGYAKNLFTVRPKKNDYVISKTIVCFTAGVIMIVAFFIGTVIGGAIAGLPFSLDGAGVGGLIMCMLSKILLMAVFVSISLTMSVFAKQKTWLSIICSLGAGMLLFAMIPMMTPLNSTILNVVLCLAGGAMFSIGLGVVSKVILNKTSLV